jgi:hypothetical protein
MGYRDYKLLLSSKQAVVADANSDNYIDTELTVPGWDRGAPLAVVVTVNTKTTAGTGIDFIICHKTSEPTVSDATLVTVRALAADLGKGAEIVIPLPQGITLLRYMRLYYDVIGGSESYTLSAYVTSFPISRT